MHQLAAVSSQQIVIQISLPGFYPLGGGGAGGKLLPQTPKLPPQTLVTDHGIQEIFGLNRIKRDLKTPQNQKISWGIPPTHCLLLW